MLFAPLDTGWRRFPRGLGNPRGIPGNSTETDKHQLLLVWWFSTHCLPCLSPAETQLGTRFEATLPTPAGFLQDGK